MNSMKNKNDLLDKSIDIDPVGVVYNMTNDIIEDFVEQYLCAKKVNGISKVKCIVKNESRNSPYVSLYLFLNKNSNAVKSEAQDIPPLLKGKLDKVSISLDDDFRKVIMPFCGNDMESGRARNGELFVKLNIFRAVGMMLDVNPNRHALVIMDAKRLPKGNSVITVVKNTNLSYGNNNNADDSYARQIIDIENRRR